MPVKTIHPNDIATQTLHGYLLGAVAPRPIAFASTVDSNGNVNLSPFSFFNVFGSNPPTLVFSPARRVRDNSIKHTLENVYETKEVVINVVNYAMVQQTSLASCEYDKGVNEFIKAGFTALPSTLVKPPRVGESPVAFECKVNQVIETGTSGGAGNLVICEVLLMHIKEEILNEKGQIDPQRIDLVARMGGDWYCRASGDALFEVPKPNQKKGIGIDQIPHSIRNSTVLTGNDLGMLGNIEAFPDKQAIVNFSNQPVIQSVLAAYKSDEDLQIRLHRTAQSYLRVGKLTEAWLTLLQKV
ncbi:flavin reductase family protein [Rhodocytophaga aerolata]|uniref:Flavin reductase family protein n=1 Tax=Rhodocytophaga aerolata TaxID=455078 RepID=A0ABT8R658_9BACT|nr:flavin reductase family protein [Rhodocytophaga aerolata]MDO1447424.1 flavin reductase family protein [Rhodocytophaga aerolata]